MSITFISLREGNKKRDALWDPQRRISLLFRAVELGGEAGEALNEVKKWEREIMGLPGSKTNISKIAEELADVVICTDLIAMQLGIDLQRAVRQKFNATSEKVGLPVKL